MGGASALYSATDKVVLDIEETQVKTQTTNQGNYLMEHDSNYIAGSCFHIKIYWIFARGPSILRNVVTRLQT